VPFVQHVNPMSGRRLQCLYRSVEEFSSSLPPAGLTRGLTRQSTIALNRVYALMDARVEPAHDDSNALRTVALGGDVDHRRRPAARSPLGGNLEKRLVFDDLLLGGRARFVHAQHRAFRNAASGRVWRACGSFVPAALTASGSCDRTGLTAF